MGPRKVTALAVAAAVALLACRGPRVSVAEISARPSPLPGAQRVEATLINAGGKGDVNVAVRLRSRADGRVFGADRTVSVRKGERLEIVVDVPAPPGAYVPAMEVEFPPE